jgi:transposase
MAILSKDLRERAGRAMDVESSYEVAARLEVSSSWVRKLWAQLRATGSVLARARGHRPRKVDAEGERVIREWIAAQPDLTIVEVMARYAAERSIKVSEPAMRKTLKRMGLSRKKRRSSLSNAKAKRTLPRARSTSPSDLGGSGED